MRGLFSLFFAFFRIGALTFGGGYAMLPMLRREVVEKHGWATDSELLDYYAVGQCTPGVIAVNTATFVGLKQRGLPGAAAATLGVVFPSVVIIVLIASVLRDFSEHPAVGHAFSGIRLAVCALIAGSVKKLWKDAVKGAFGVAVALAAFAVSAFLGLSPVWTVLCSAVAGMIASRFERGRGG